MERAQLRDAARQVRKIKREQAALDAQAQEIADTALALADAHDAGTLLPPQPVVGGDTSDLLIGPVGGE